MCRLSGAQSFGLSVPDSPLAVHIPALLGAEKLGISLLAKAVLIFMYYSLCPVESHHVYIVMLCLVKSKPVRSSALRSLAPESTVPYIYNPLQVKVDSEHHKVEHCFMYKQVSLYRNMGQVASVIQNIQVSQQRPVQKAPDP